MFSQISVSIWKSLKGGDIFPRYGVREDLEPFTLFICNWNWNIERILYSKKFVPCKKSTDKYVIGNLNTFSIFSFHWNFFFFSISLPWPQIVDNITVNEYIWVIIEKSFLKCQIFYNFKSYIFFYIRFFIFNLKLCFKFKIKTQHFCITCIKLNQKRLKIAKVVVKCILKFMLVRKRSYKVLECVFGMEIHYWKAYTLSCEKNIKETANIYF